MITSDSIIKTDIQNTIKFEPGLKSPNIIVNVENGIATLTGSVERYYEKSLAEKTVKSIRGVKGVVDELQVSFGESLKRSDEEIARAALQSLEWDSSIPSNQIKVIVEHGVVKLSGEVDWQYQRNMAHQDVKYLFGVKNVINDITLKIPLHIKSDDVSRKILSGFQRNASLDARQVHVETEGSRVILKGCVRSWSEYEEARRAAWSVLGVTEVDSDQLDIKYQG